MKTDVEVENGKQKPPISALTGERLASETVRGQRVEENRHPVAAARMPFRIIAGIVSVACAGLFLLLVLAFAPGCPPAIVYALLLLVLAAEFGSIAIRGNGLYFLISERLRGRSGKDSARPADENDPE